MKKFIKVISVIVAAIIATVCIISNKKADAETFLVANNYEYASEYIPMMQQVESPIIFKYFEFPCFEVNSNLAVSDTNSNLLILFEMDDEKSLYATFCITDDLKDNYTSVVENVFPFGLNGTGIFAEFRKSNSKILTLKKTKSEYGNNIQDQFNLINYYKDIDCADTYNNIKNNTESLKSHLTYVTIPLFSDTFYGKTSMPVKTFNYFILGNIERASYGFQSGQTRLNVTTNIYWDGSCNIVVSPEEKLFTGDRITSDELSNIYCGMNSGYYKFGYTYVTNNTFGISNDNIDSYYDSLDNFVIDYTCDVDDIVLTNNRNNILSIWCKPINKITFNEDTYKFIMDVGGNNNLVNTVTEIYVGNRLYTIALCDTKHGRSAVYETIRDESTLNKFDSCFGDVDNDGLVTCEDAMCILQYYTESISNSNSVSLYDWVNKNK